MQAELGSTACLERLSETGEEGNESIRGARLETAGVGTSRLLCNSSGIEAT